MKFKVEEHRKHQIIGVTVLLSVAVVFFPAYFKQSNHGIDKKIHLSINMPQQPVQPKIQQPGTQQMFQSIQVSHVDLTNKIKKELAHKNSRDVAQSISIQRGTKLAASRPSKSRKSIIKPEDLKLAKGSMPSEQRERVKHKTENTNILQAYYAVQIASFTVEQNASSLVSKLRQKGYKANYGKFTNHKGSYYRVLVGELKKKQAAKALQQQLTESIKLNGIVIKTGVS